MGCFDLFLCLFFPPLAVIDKGCGSFLLVLILLPFGWIPATIAALIIISTHDVRK